MGSKASALSLAAALVGWSYWLGPKLPERWRPPVHIALATVLASRSGVHLGLRPPAVWSGLAWGSAAATVVTAAVATTTALPPVRRAMAVRDVPMTPVAWLGYRIPAGTVWPEEVAFRGALATLGGAAFGSTGGRLLQATAFGLSHIADARSAGEPVVGTVLVTGLAGWVFGWLATRSGSLAAPMLAHLAINECGAIAALLVQRGARRS